VLKSIGKVCQADKPVISAVLVKLTVQQGQEIGGVTGAKGLLQSLPFDEAAIARQIALGQGCPVPLPQGR
jgi:hypothetical protein